MIVTVPVAKRVLSALAVATNSDVLGSCWHLRRGAVEQWSGLV